MGFFLVLSHALSLKVLTPFGLPRVSALWFGGGTEGGRNSLLATYTFVLEPGAKPSIPTKVD